MAYVLEILNTSDAKVAQLDENECEVEIIRKLNSEWNIKVIYPIPINLEQDEDKTSHFTTWKNRLRLMNPINSTDYNTFIISKTEKIRKPSGAIALQIYGEHKAVIDMNSEIIDTNLSFSYVTPTVALTKIMGYSTNWAHGSVTPTNKISLYVGWETVLSALQKLLKKCDGEYDIDEANGEIDVHSSMGSNNYVHIRPGLNLKSIINTQFSRNVVNKIFGVGGGDPPATIAGARHIVKSYDAGSKTTTVEGNNVVPENDSWNTNYEMYFVTGAEKGNAFTITDCVAGTTDDTITLGTDETIAAGDKFVIRTTGHAEVNFIRAGSSITDYGSIEGTYRDSRFLDVINLVETPKLDGTYAAGLCADWSKNSLPTLSENTDANYIMYGTKSQKVIGVDDNDGIYQAVVTETGKYYRILVWVYISGGTVEVILSTAADNFSISKSSTGWQRFTFFEKADATTMTIRIYQTGAPVATFYVDAIQLTEGILERSFVSNSDLKELWDDTYLKLIEKKDPLIEYKANFIDLFKIDKNNFPFNEISLGDTVTITDDDLGISGVTARVKQIRQKVFRPEITEHTVSNII